MIGVIKKMVISGYIFLLSMYMYYFSKPDLEPSTKQNIIIVGGELFNKGAQAMTFTVVDQMKRKYPSKNIYLFSTDDFNRKTKEKNIYSFDIMPWNLTTKINIATFLTQIVNGSNKYKYMEEQIKEIVRNGYMIIDISGYALSSQWNWFKSIDYLLNIVIARKYSIKYYIFPQSIGPFNYKPIHKIILYPMMKLYLKYPEKIFVRENEGFSELSKFTQKNVVKSHDIVLYNDTYILKNIYNKEPEIKSIQVKTNSIGIIPNMKIVERANPEIIYSIYYLLVTELLKQNKIVYLLKHSDEDMEFCEHIKKYFVSNNNVILIKEDLNVFDLEKLIKQLDFVIASRYHSIIHSYKNEIPALVIGWATKYPELMNDFEQLEYYFDARTEIDEINMTRKLKKMIHEYKNEKIKIKIQMDIIAHQDIFEMI